MSALASYWAKSPSGSGTQGESLTAHLDATYRAAGQLAHRIGDVRCLDDSLREQFWRIVELAAVTHDAGKLADGFQRMVKGQSRVWGQRHEALSVGFVAKLIEDQPVREWVSLAVATHHRHLVGSPDGGRKPSLSALYSGLLLDEFADEIGDVDAAAVTELLYWIAGTAELAQDRIEAVSGLSVVASAHAELMHLLKRWGPPVQEEAGLSAVLLQGAVTLADHLSSAHGSLHPAQPIDATFRTQLQERLVSGGRSIRPHQLRAAHTDGHMILRAPTGSGKTEGGLLWAARQLERIGAERGCVPRLFYTLPYLASINAMADRLGDEVGDAERVGVAHSRAGSYHLAAAIEPDDQPEEDGFAAGGRGTAAHAARKAVSRAAATRLFRETVRVGTPYQLLRGALAGPIHAGVLLDCTNSVFLLDELHAYDTRRLGFILASMSFWEKLGGSIGVLSATLPEALIELVHQSVDHEVSVIDGHGADTAARHRVQLREHHLTDEPTIDEIRQRLLEGRSVLVVANNVGHAQDLFAALAPISEQIHGPDGAHLLHARFARRDRNAIERAIRNRYGTKAARRGGLLVATQTIEVSLDLDFDLMHTSAAPLEALLQRFGRVNRLGQRPPADVVVNKPAYKQRGKSGPEFADGIYSAEPTRHSWQILARHVGQPVDERTTVDWLNEIYDSAWGVIWRKEVDEHRGRFARDFLTFIAPFEDRDDLEVQFDTLFEGTEAILTTDLDKYHTALDKAAGAAGRLLAEDWLIPLPHYARTKYNKHLRVHLVDAEYDSRTGLGPLRTATGSQYIAGEIL